jgi:[ribosomal protein S5]-alanine N-acetyltransferase
MKKLLVTERLYLRPFELGDEGILTALNADPEVVRYTGDGSFRDAAHAHEVLTQVILPQYAWGMGRWAVHLKADDTFIGWCGLKKHPDGKIDLGYRFFVEYWGKGYATESAKAVMDYGFQVLSLPEIEATADAGNKASIHVLEKLGMLPNGTGYEHGAAVIYFIKTRP